MKLFVIISTALFLCSCSTSPVEPSSFLTDTYKMESGMFFQKVWNEEGFDFKKYDSIAIAPVTTKFLRNLGWWDKMNATNYIEEKESPTGPLFKKDGHVKMAHDMSKYFYEKIVSEFKKPENNRLQYKEYDERDNRTLVLSVAIIELVPIKKYMVGLGLVGSGALKGGTIAIEGNLIDSASNKVVAMFADRKINNRPQKLGHKTRLSFYTHAKPVMNSWAKLFVELTNVWNPLEIR